MKLTKKGSNMLGGFGITELLICCGAVAILLVTALAVFFVLWLTQERFKNKGGRNAENKGKILYRGNRCSHDAFGRPWNGRGGRG